MGFGGFCPLPIRLGGGAVSGWSAANHARAVADIVAMKRAAPLLWLTFSQASLTATVEAFCSQWGSETDLRPTWSCNATGSSLWTVTLARADSYDVVAPISVRHAIVGAHYSGTCRRAVANVLDDGTNRISIHLMTSAGALCDGRATVVLW